MDMNHTTTAIAQLDLQPIKVKLMHAESGEGWTLARAEAVEKEYKRFLFLMMKFPQEQTAPLVDVDTFWHYHILDTMKYAADCEQVFGYFLHHYPYVGMGDEDGAAEARTDAADRMRTLYEETFGESYLQAARAMAGDSAYCGATANAAYCGVTAAKAAYCGAAAKAAYCGAAVKTAYCGAAVKAAYCGIAAQSAYCGASTKAAYCGAATKAAYCGAANKAAYCGAAVKAAYCGVTAAPAAAAYCGRAVSQSAALSAA